MTGQAVGLNTGFGDRPYIPFVDRSMVGTAEEHQYRATTPEHLAVASMALASLDALPVHGRGISGNNDPEDISIAAPTLDIEYVRAVARLHPGGSSDSSHAGMVRSLLQQGFSVDVTGRYGGTLGSPQARELNVYRGFTYNNRYPRTEHLREALGTVGVSAAAWIEVTGGLPRENMATRGKLAFVLLGGTEEKVKVHMPGNAEVAGVEGLYLDPVNLLVPGKSTLFIASRPKRDIHGTLTS
jgi:hypothetical protein